MSAATFNLNQWMSENRELVITKHTTLSNEQFFSGISLRDFMVATMRGMQMNGVRSAKQAASTLPNVMGMLYMDNVKIGVVYSKPYAESNHAKQVNYFGAQKAEMLNNI
jgi:hypothetical protein